MREIHGNDSNFNISCELCGRTYKKWDSLKKHLHRDHAGECVDVGLRRSENDGTSNIQEGSYTEVGDGNAHQSVLESQPIPLIRISDGPDQKWGSARFLLKTTEEQSLTYLGTDILCNSIQNLVDDVCCRIKGNIETVLPNTLSNHERESILTACSTPVIFDGLTTRYLREKFYREKFNYSVSMYTVYVRDILLHLYQL